MKYLIITLISFLSACASTHFKQGFAGDPSHQLVQIGKVEPADNVKAGKIKVLEPHRKNQDLSQNKEHIYAVINSTVFMINDGCAYENKFFTKIVYLEQRIVDAEAEKRRLEAEEERRRLEAEAEKRRLAAEAESRKLEAEAEKRRLAAAKEERNLGTEKQNKWKIPWYITCAQKDGGFKIAELNFDAFPKDEMVVFLFKDKVTSYKRTDLSNISIPIISNNYSTLKEIY